MKFLNSKALGKLKFYGTNLLSSMNPGTLTAKVLWKGRPYNGLTKSRSKKAGRNRLGRITVRHRGGGHKRLGRTLEFRRFLGQTVTVLRVEYDPNRSAWIALVKLLPASNSQSAKSLTLLSLNSQSSSLKQDQHSLNPKTTKNLTLFNNSDTDIGTQIFRANSDTDSSLRKHNMQYWLATHDLKPGRILNVSTCVDIRPGNTSRLSDLPIGTRIHHLEIHPGQGAQVLRAAGVSGFLISKITGSAIVRLSSGRQISLSDQCLATIGQTSNVDHQHREIGKAGRSRWLGWRPTVRGVAMNPIDHPHGGGEGKTSGGRPSCSPWGRPTKGARTSKKAAHKN